MHERRRMQVLRIGVLSTLLLITLFPLYVMISSSMKPLSDVQATWQWIPSAATFTPYLRMWETVPLARYFLNSAVVSIVATAFAVLLATFAAYTVSRYRFRGRNSFRLVVLSTQMFPGILFLLPLFVIFVNIEQLTGITFYGSYLGLVITYLTFALPFSIWMLAGYFDSIPKELEEAARVDGTTTLGALFRVILPLSKPGLTAVAIFAFMIAWGELLFASVLTDASTHTLAIGLQQYSTRSDVFWNQLMAAAITVSIPVVAGFLSVRRHFTRGLAAGGFK